MLIATRLNDKESQNQKCSKRHFVIADHAAVDNAG
jgi:hypothetical protein